MGATSGLSEPQDQSSRNIKVVNHSLPDKESSMLSTHLYWVEPALFQELSVVERPVFLKLFPSTTTLSASSTSFAEKEETKWLRYSMSSQSLRSKLTVKCTVSCREPALSPTPPTCLSQQEKLPSTLVSLSLSTSEIWDTTSL